MTTTPRLYYWWYIRYACWSMKESDRSGPTPYLVWNTYFVIRTYHSRCLKLRGTLRVTMQRRTRTELLESDETQSFVIGHPCFLEADMTSGSPCWTGCTSYHNWKDYAAVGVSHAAHTGHAASMSASSSTMTTYLLKPPTSIPSATKILVQPTWYTLFVPFSGIVANA